jgi:hypothetical protein
MLTSFSEQMVQSDPLEYELSAAVAVHDTFWVGAQRRRTDSILEE